MANRPDIRQLLEDLYDRDGKLTDEQIVTEAADSTSDLHPYFEWDDTTAAHSHRLNQARSLIRRYKVRIDVGVDERVEVRAFVSEPDMDGYTPIRVVLDDEARKAALFRELRADLRAFARRLKSFEEFDGVVSAIDKLGGG